MQLHQRQRSVSKAAERLFVTQPAVSMQTRQLEDAFGLAVVSTAKYFVPMLLVRFG